MASSQTTIFALVGDAFLPRVTNSLLLPLRRKGLDVRCFNSSVPMRSRLEEAKIILVHVCRSGQFLETVADLAQVTEGKIPIVAMADCSRARLPGNLAGVYFLHKPYSHKAVLVKIDELVG